jgi:hypothetical protein
MSESAGQQTTWPEELLREADWRFWGEHPVESRGEFEETVRQWHARLEEGQRSLWAPEQVLLHAPRVRIEYFGVHSEDEEEYDDFFVELESEDGRAFTGGELLFKLHNAVVEHLNCVDHCYMEGLRLQAESSTEQLPVYQMIQGS